MLKSTLSAALIALSVLYTAPASAAPISLGGISAGRAVQKVAWRRCWWRDDGVWVTVLTGITVLTGAGAGIAGGGSE
jgi:hypothetical protein